MRVKLFSDTNQPPENFTHQKLSSTSLSTNCGTTGRHSKLNLIQSSCEHIMHSFGTIRRKKIESSFWEVLLRESEPRNMAE